MIVVSSFRALGNDPEWDRNQMLAFRSWMMFAEQIVLFGAPQPQLRHYKVKFVDCEDFPKIKDMVIEAAKHRNKYVAITNGDIVLSPDMRKIETRMRGTKAACASSRRWHFDPNQSMGQAIQSASLTDKDGRDDRGRDVFVARADVWNKLSSEIPDKFRIGNAQWDAWVTDAFRRHWDARFLDFTAQRIVFHPHHEGRQRPYDELIAITP